MLSSTSTSLRFLSSSSSIRGLATRRLISTSTQSFNQNTLANQSSSSSQDSSSSSSSSSRNQNRSKSSSKETKPLSQTEAIEFKPSDLSTFPSLIHRTSPLYDAGITFQSPPVEGAPYPSSYTLVNEEGSRLFKSSPPSAEALIASSGGSTSGTSGSDSDGAEYLSSVTSLSVREINDLHRHALQIKRVVRMSGKGKIARISALVVAGNGKGLVGYGEAKDGNGGVAAKKAFQQAVKSMDYVQRYENRTVETEIEGKWSATRVILRPRPAGFGLRVPPSIHAVARSAGLSDLSASIRGSTNPSAVVKATLQALWPGSAPIGLGDGLGGKARRADKGTGPRTREEIMRERGRRLEEVRLD